MFKWYIIVIIEIYPQYSSVQCSRQDRAAEWESVSGCVILSLLFMAACSLTQPTISLWFTPARPGEAAGYTNNYIHLAAV